MQQEIINDINHLQRVNRILTTRISRYKAVKARNSIKLHRLQRKNTKYNLTINEYALLNYIKISDISITDIDITKGLSNSLFSIINKARNDLLYVLKYNNNVDYNININGKGIIKYDSYIFTVNNFNIINCKKDDNK